MYISEKIGEEYREWKNGDVVFIESQTGTGKTHFILHTLLPYAKSMGRKILYLVNRKILKEQLDAELKKLPAWESCYIQIETYQTLECKMHKLDYNGVLQPGGEGALYQYTDSYYVVCDECHYFLMDSTFNTYTFFSFGWIEKTFATRVRIFISATITKIKDVIQKEQFRLLNARNATSEGQYIVVNAGYATNEGQYIVVNGKEYTYLLQKNYEDLEIHIIEKIEAIIQEIEADPKSKWLIFVDSIDTGKDIEKKLKKKAKEELCDSDELCESEEFCDKEDRYDVTLLTAGYRYDQNGLEEMEGIVEKRQQNARILIATSVMDNGISLEDTDLRNVVIFADTEEEFIQMLGRKRKESGNFKLYIYKYDKRHFENRYKYYSRLKEIADQYYIKQKNDLEYGKNQELIQWELHSLLLDDIFSGKIDYNLVRKMFCSFNGRLLLNVFAMNRITDLAIYYDQMKRLFDSDGQDAFIREQLKWLGIEGDSANEIIEYANMGEIVRCKNEITSAFEKNCGKLLTEKENLELKATLYDPLQKLIMQTTEEQWKLFSGKYQEKDNKKSLLNWNSKKDSSHPMSSTLTDFLCCCFDIPYSIKTHRRGKDREETQYEILRDESVPMAEDTESAGGEASQEQN